VEIWIEHGSGIPAARRLFFQFRIKTEATKSGLKRFFSMRYVMVLLLLLSGYFKDIQGSTPGVRSMNVLRSTGGRTISFLVGVKGGVNFSMVFPTQRFSVLQPVTGTDASQGDKDYDFLFRNAGYQYGFIGMLKINRLLSVSLEPSFGHYAFHYSTKSAWISTSDPSGRIEATSHFTDKLRYFEIPLELRYELGGGQIRPFLAAGFFYGMLTNATGKAELTTSQYLNGIEIAFDHSESTVDISGNYISTRLATYPGIGLMVNLDYAVLFAEADYYLSLHNIVNESARFSNQQSVGGSYNVPDNLKFDNLVFNLGILFNINRFDQGGERGKGSAVECPVFKRNR
jgi:hypothetical protein